MKSSICLIIILLALVSCNKDEPSINQNEVYLFEEISNEVFAYDFVSQSSRVIGSIEVPDWAYLTLDRNTNSNVFLDLASNSILVDAWNKQNQANYILTFDYSEGSMIDSIRIDFPFTLRYFYSSQMNSILSYVDGYVHKLELTNYNIEEELIYQDQCGWEHQGINNNQNLFYNYGCNITTIYDLINKEVEFSDHYDVIDRWRGLYSVGLSEDKDFLIGFGLYQRHFPEDPNFIGTFDSIRNELYLVKRDLITGSFEDLQIDTNFGFNNGFYNSSKNLYFLLHDNDLLIYNSNLDLISSQDIGNSKFLIKQ